jgi:ATP-dependent helicase HrpA
VFDPRIDEFRWMLEELRVSLWAQQLKTPYPISFKRLARYWEQATAPRSSAGNR